jgi:choline-sulfatase
MNKQSINTSKISSSEVLGMALISLAVTPAFAQQKPNVVFIMTDQQSYNMLSSYGNKWVKTPNIDKISRMGTRFDNTYCVNPLSMPSRFSLLTGHYSSEVGEKTNGHKFNKEKVAEISHTDGLGFLFKKAGYTTLYSGKTHLMGKNEADDYGFEMHGLNPYHEPANYAEKALPELAQTKKPFFLFLSFMNPHDICYSAGIDPRYPDKLPAENVTETKRWLEFQKTLTPEQYRSQIPPKPANYKPITDEPKEMASTWARDSWTEEQWDLYRWMYCRLTESVDEQIGRVLTSLEKSGMMENTIIVFTSDHGEMGGSHGCTTKSVMFEECQRVPFIFAGKGIKSNQVDKSTLVCNGLDFIPTICDLTGLEYSKQLPGISLKSYLTGKGKTPDRKYIITEDCNAFQIHDGRYKLTIFELPENPETLTDIKNDPGETINFANDPDFSKIKAGLKEKLMDNLSKRGLLPLEQNRTRSFLRKMT